LLQDQENEKDQPDETVFFRHTAGDDSIQFKNRYHDRFRHYLKQCGDLLTDRIGAENIEGILLTGSFSLGEGSILFDDETATFLSDVDLLVIIDDLKLLLRLLPEKNRLARECESLFHHTIFEGNIDVGIVTVAEARKFARSPGVFDMRRHSILLAGDETLKNIFPAFEADQVAGSEGIILLENRIVSFLGAYPGPDSMTARHKHRMIYQVAKVYTDILAAAFCLSGNFISGYEKRWEHLSGDDREGGTVDLVGRDILGKAGKWVEYKLSPSKNTAENMIGDPSQLWLEAARDLITAWKRYESFLQGKDHSDADPVTVDLLRSRSGRRWKKINILAWKGFLADQSVRRRFSVINNLWRSIPKKMPLEIVRETGVRLLDQAVSKGIDTDFSRVAKWYSSRRKNFADAAGDLNRIWKMIVFGRGD